MLTECQKGLLELLKEIDDICTKHNIDYYLAGGTFMGAVRHGGFLPWDNDADIHMTRDAIEKFASLQDEFLPGRFVVSKYTHEEFPTIHWRYMNGNQTTILHSTFMTDSPQGQYVDIFILDPIPNDEKKQQELLEKYYLYAELKVNAFIIDSRRSDAFFEQYKALRDEQKQNGYHQVIERLEKELYEYPEQGNDYYLVRSPLAPCPIYPKKLWGKPIRVPFEGVMLPVACKPEQVLMMAYGNRWVDIPPLGEQETHPFVTDLDIPYTVYEEENKKYLDKKGFLDFKYKKKDRWFEIVGDRNCANKQAIQLQAYAELVKIENKIAAGKLKLEKLVEQGRFDVLKDLFRNYYRIQFSKMKFYGNYFEMPDAYLWAALYPLVMEGDYLKLLKVVELRGSENLAPLSENMQQLKELCDACVDITNDIYVFKKYKKAKKLIDQWITIYPKMITLCRADICVSYLLEEDLEEMLPRLKRYLRYYPNDGELLKYYGDYLIKTNETEDAIRYYKKAYSTVANGFVQTEIKHILQEYDR